MTTLGNDKNPISKTCSFGRSTCYNQNSELLEKDTLAVIRNDWLPISIVWRLGRYIIVKANMKELLDKEKLIVVPNDWLPAWSNCSLGR